MEMCSVIGSLYLFFVFFVIITVGWAGGDRHYHCQFKTNGDEVYYNHPLSLAEWQNQ
jgi:hypothetical protein